MRQKLGSENTARKGYSSKTEFILSQLPDQYSLETLQLATGDCVNSVDTDRWLVLQGSLCIVGTNEMSFIAGEGSLLFASGFTNKK